MNEVLKKIDAEIAEHYLIINDTKRYSHSTIDYHETKVEVLEEIKEIILAEQKEPCHGCKHKGKTIDQYPCNMCPRIYTDKFTPINQPQEGDKNV